MRTLTDKVKERISNLEKVPCSMDNYERSRIIWNPDNKDFRIEIFRRWCNLQLAEPGFPDFKRINSYLKKIFKDFCASDGGSISMNGLSLYEFLQKTVFSFPEIQQIIMNIDPEGFSQDEFCSIFKDEIFDNARVLRIDYVRYFLSNKKLDLELSDNDIYEKCKNYGIINEEQKKESNKTMNETIINIFYICVENSNNPSEEIIKSGTTEDIIDILTYSNKNTQKVNDMVLNYVIRSSLDELKQFHELTKRYTLAGARFAAITYSFLTNEENINCIDEDKKKFLNEFASKCFIAMNFNPETSKCKKLSPLAVYKTEIMTRHLGTESFLGKKRGNNEYDKSDKDHWGLISGDFFIQSKYETRKSKNSNPERYINIPLYYGERSGMLDDNIERIIKLSA